MNNERKPDGYWRDFENVRKHLEPIIFNNKLPGHKVVKATLGGSIDFAIANYHGGYTEIHKKIGEFPTIKKLESMKRWDLVRAIVQNGGITQFKQKIFK